MLLEKKIHTKMQRADMMDRIYYRERLIDLQPVFSFSFSHRGPCVCVFENGNLVLIGSFDTLLLVVLVFSLYDDESCLSLDNVDKRY